MRMAQRVARSWFKVLGSGFLVQGSWFRVLGSGFLVQGQRETFEKCSFLPAQLNPFFIFNRGSSSRKAKFLTG